MSRWMPLLTLALLLMAAGGVFVAGWTLSRGQRIQVEPRDRQGLRAFVRRAQSEIRQLEQRYEARIAGAIRDLDVTDPPSVRRTLDELVAVVSCEVRIPGDEPWRIDVDYREFLPVGWAQRMRSVEVSSHEGWQAEEDHMFLFSDVREDGVMVTLTILAPALERVITAALAAMKVDFRRLQTGGGDLDEWMDPTGGVMVAAKQTADRFDVPPDVVLPLHSRFGTWEIRSWDRRTRVTELDTGLQTGAALVSCLLVLGGVGLFVGQRRAVRLAEQRVSFVNRVSHELRTPLTNMLLNLDLAAEEVASPGKAAARLELVREESDRLARLIDNVLTFSRVEQGRLETEIRDVDVAALIEKTVASFSPLLERRGIRLDVSMESPSPWRTDPDALSQILANLLSNLEKYAPRSTAELTAAADAEALVIRLSDDGPGIPESDAKRIFRPFERLQGTVTEGVSGTGLGLNIARDLAEKLGGSLSLIPSAEGAAFEIRLPMMEAVAT